MELKINKQIFRQSLLVIIMLELISLLGYWYSGINTAFFILFATTALIISIWRLEWGVLIVFIELFISSKGYLFYIDLDGISISIRIALWLIVMGVWLAKFLQDMAKHEYPDKKIFKNKILVLVAILYFFIGFAFVNGLINKNSFNNIFFDANGWFYFSLVFPLYRVWSNEFFTKLTTIFFTSVIWISVKSLLLLFLFSHQLPGMTYDIYRWVRESGVGEITQLEGGFYRIFFQSHIFIFIAFFVVLLLYTKGLKEAKRFKTQAVKVLLLSILFSVILIGFSRSNWMGLAVGSLLFLVIIPTYFKLSFKKFSLLVASAIVISVLGLGTIVAVVKFPYPKPIGGFSTAGLLKDRASQISGEAAATSRWRLLPVLVDEIKRSPILGYGFGKTVTYETEDPRAKEMNQKSQYTTYAFEWGWLDIWLKLGLLGLISYVALLLSLVLNAMKNKNILSITILISIVLLSTIHFLSPYLNHPLGIGFLLISIMIIKKSEGCQVKNIQ